MLKVIASSTCDVCFVEYADDNPPYCIPCGHLSCRSCLESMIAANANSNDPNSARCAFCRTLFDQSGVRRLHVDLGAVPSEVASSDGSETINGDDEDENRSLAREAEKLAVGVANATFEKDADKIRRTSADAQRWIGVQRRTRPSAGFPALTALTQLAVGNMENYLACRLLEQKLLDSRGNEAKLLEKVQSFEESSFREQQNFEKIRALEQELDDLKQSLTSSERSLRTTTSSLADATASLAEADTALAAAKAELASRQDVRTERDTLKTELQTAKDEARKAKRELRAFRTEADGGKGDVAGKQEEAVDSAAETPKQKIGRRRSRKFSHSAPKAAAVAAAAATSVAVATTVDDPEPAANGSGSVSKKADGTRHVSKKSRRKMDAEQTEDEGKEQGDHAKGDDHAKSGEHSRSKGHSKDKERGRERHRERNKDKDKDLDKDNDEHPPPEPELAAASPPRPHTTQPEGSEPKASGEKHHKSGKNRKKTHAAHDRPTSPERAATAPPGTEAETQAALNTLTDSLSSPKPDLVTPPAPVPVASTSKNASTPPPAAPRRGLVQTAADALSKPGLSRDGPAMRVLRKAMGRKAASPNASHDLGSASTVVNMTPGPSSSPAGSSAAAPAAPTPPAPSTTIPPPAAIPDPPVTSIPAPGSSADPLQVPRTVAYSPYLLPEVENIAGFGVPTLPHGQSFGPYPHSDPRRFPESAARARAQAATPESDHRPPNPLPRPPRATEEEPETGYEQTFAWPYDAVWDQNRGARGTGKGRERERERDRTYDRKQRSTRDRRHLPSEWQEEGVAPVRRYVAAEDVPNFSASSRHVFDNVGGGYGDSPPAYPMFEHGMMDSGMPRKASYGNLRGMK